MENFYIGKTFNEDLYAEAYDWLLSQSNPNLVIRIIEPSEDGTRMYTIIDNTPTQEEVEKEKQQRISMLSLTSADVERGIYQAKGMDFDDILAFVMANPPQGLDVKALRIELKANHFYRGNPYVNAVGTLLGFTSEQLDKFFETNDYTTLLPQSDKVEGESDKVSDIVTEQVEEKEPVITETETDEV